MKGQIGKCNVVNPKTVILHVGSNNIKKCQSFDHLLGDIYDLAVTAKSRFPSARIVLSGVLFRRDVWPRKIRRVNRDMEWVAQRLGLLFVDPNGWVNESGLGRDGVHLNRKGVAELSGLFTRVAGFCSAPGQNH